MKRPLSHAAALCWLAAGLLGCRQGMYNQPKQKPLSAADFFPDGASARNPVPGAVAQEQPPASPLTTGSNADGTLVTILPMPLTRALLERGQQRYDIFCAVCHDYTGSGLGMIVQRGFPPPPTFHQDRLRNAPIGHFFDVITHGYGAMYSYAARVPPDDRWAIAAYIRALQLARNAARQDVPPDEQTQLESPATAAAP